MRLSRLPEVKGKIGHRSDASVYNDIRDGLCTRGVSIGQRAKAWPEHEIDAIIAARIAGRSDEELRVLVRSLHAQRTEMSQGDVE